MSNENNSLPIVPSEIRRGAERQREDAEMISNLCTALESAVLENRALKEKLAKLETKVPDDKKPKT
jgi:hypothetical protein